MSQVQVIGKPSPKSWDDYEEGCLSTFGGGYSDVKEAEIFRHGMSTVFRLIGGEFPPAEQCRAASDLLAACKRAAELYDDLSIGTLEAAARYGPDYEPPTANDCLRVRGELDSAIAKATPQKAARTSCTKQTQN